MEYSPSTVAFWLRSWLILESLAESPSTSAHLLSPECRQSDRACSNGRPVGIRDVRSRSDGMRYADIRADLQAAHATLPPYSLESLVIAARMRETGPMSAIRERLKVRNNDLWAAYRAACKAMAISLGWEEDTH